MDKSTLLEILSSPIAYYSIFAKVGGGVTAGVFLSQLIYWTGKSKLADGWLWKSADEMEHETGLTRAEQETARRKLKARGLIEEHLSGVPATLHYRVDLDAVVESVNQFGKKCQTGLAESAKLDSVKVPNLIGEKCQTIHRLPENTPEITHRGDDALCASPAPESKPEAEPEAPAQPIAENPLQRVKALLVSGSSLPESATPAAPPVPPAASPSESAFDALFPRSTTAAPAPVGTAADLRTEAGRAVHQGALLAERRAKLERKPFLTWGGRTAQQWRARAGVEVDADLVLEICATLEQRGVYCGDKPGTVRFWLTQATELARAADWKAPVALAALEKALRDGISLKSPGSCLYAVNDLQRKRIEADASVAIDNGRGVLVSVYG